MKKNLLTILLTILIIVLLLFLGNLLRNFLILKGICNSNEEFKNSKQGYHFTSTTYPNLTFIKNTKSDMYFYNGVYFIKTYINNEFESSTWYDSNAKNGISKNTDLEGERTFGEDNTIPDYFKNTIYMNALLTNTMSSNNAIAEVLKLYLFKPITSEGENYIIEYNNSTVYINKETKFITKCITKGNTSKDISAYENTIDFNNISENDVSKDNLFK